MTIDTVKGPPERTQSARERLLGCLSSTPVTARTLSRLAGLSERDVCLHLQHLQKSLKSKGRRLLISPPACLDCHFVYRKRDRITRPGKCPACRSSHLSEPLFSVE